MRALIFGVFSREQKREGVREELGLRLASECGECLFVHSAMLAACEHSDSWILSEAFLETGPGLALLKHPLSDVCSLLWGIYTTPKWAFLRRGGMHQPARAGPGLSTDMGKYCHAQGASWGYLPPLSCLVKMVHISLSHTG